MRIQYFIEALSLTAFRGEHCLEMETSGGQDISVFDQGTKQPPSSSTNHRPDFFSPYYMEAQVAELHAVRNNRLSQMPTKHLLAPCKVRLR